MEIKLVNEVSWGGNRLAPVVDWALKELNLNYNFELIESDELLKELNIKSPAMLINEKIVIAGRVPSLKEVKIILEKEILKNTD